MQHTPSGVGTWVLVILVLALFTCGLACLLLPFALLASGQTRYHCGACGLSWTPQTAALGAISDATITAAQAAHQYLSTRIRPTSPEWLPVALGSAGALGLTLLIVGTWQWRLIGAAIIVASGSVAGYFYWGR